MHTLLMFAITKKIGAHRFKRLGQMCSCLFQELHCRFRPGDEIAPDHRDVTTPRSQRQRDALPYATGPAWP